MLNGVYVRNNNNQSLTRVMHGKTIDYEKNPIMNEEFKLLLYKKKKNE